MPTYYQNINGRLIGGRPEIIRLEDGCEPLITNYNKKTDFNKNETEHFNKNETGHFNKNETEHFNKNETEHFNKNDINNSDYVQNMINSDANHFEEIANCNNTYVFQRKYNDPLEVINNQRDDFNHPHMNTPGFRFALDKPKIGLRPSYASYVYKCPQIKYNSTDFYPFLLNDNLLFPPNVNTTYCNK